jgi:formylglycine-generating enzyme required for sulfatase activity
MADIVSEWVLDDYASSYVGISNQQANCSQSDCSNLLQKVVRGGSWISKENELRNTFRKDQNGNETSPYIGFRIIK